MLEGNEMKRILVLFIMMLLIGSCAISTVSLSESISETENISTDEINIQSSNSEFYTHQYSQRYAMIVIGEYQTSQHYIWFLKAAQNLYNVLKSENYGFSDDEIFVLLTIKGQWNEPDIFDDSIVDYEASEANLQNVLDRFKSGGENELSSDGLLFFTFIDHGRNDVFGLEGGDSVSSSELYSYTEGINGRSIYIFQPCMSGSFVDDMSKPGRIVAASVLPFQSEGGWIESFTRGLDGVTDSDHPNGAIDSRPDDDRISFEEAFYQAAYHIQDDAPLGKYSLLDDNGDGKGSAPFLFDGKGYDINDKTKDGYRASRVFYLTYEEFPLNVKAKKSGEKNTVNFEGIASGGAPPYSWHWDFGDGETSTDQNPTHTYDEEGEYKVTLTVTDSNEDTGEDTITVKIPLSKSKARLLYLQELIRKIFKNHQIIQHILNNF